MHQTDILAIGGGIAGTATTCYLAQYGRHVILVLATCVTNGNSWPPKKAVMASWHIRYETRKRIERLS